MYRKRGSSTFVQTINQNQLPIMFNSRGRQTSQPITINPIHHSQERHPHRGNMLDDGIPSDSDDDMDIGIDINAHHNDHEQNHGHGDGNSNSNIDGNSNLSTSYLNSNFDNLTVGSLPSSRRERRFMVTHGNNERLGGAGANSTGAFSAAGHDASSRGRSRTGVTFGHQINFSASTSTAASSKYRNGEHDLSRSMPNAPSLASRRDRASGVRLSRIPNLALPESVTDSEASSLPYGSLNESQFRLPLAKSISELEDGDHNFASSVDRRSGSGQMQDIQKKVQLMKKNGSLVKNDVSGLASLFGARNDSEGNNNSNGMSVGGIGALSMSKDMEPQVPTIGSSSKDEYRSIGGIGSVVQQSSLSQQLESSSQSYSNIGHNSISSSFIKSGTGQNGSALQDYDGEQLSTSLTGLSILQTSPKNMVNLEQEQREALANLRSKSFSEEEEWKNGTTNGSIGGTRDSIRTREIWNARRRLSNGSQHSDLEDEDDAAGGLFDFEMDI